MQFYIKQAAIAALYVALTLAVWPIAFGAIQIRISEVLMILILFNHKHLTGLTLGVIIANLFNVGVMHWDMLFGTLGTLTAGLLMVVFRKKPAIALIFPVINNAFFVAISLYLTWPTATWMNIDFTNFGTFMFYFTGVFVGQVISAYIFGLVAYYFINKNKDLVAFLACDHLRVYHTESSNNANFNDQNEKNDLFETNKDNNKEN